jgi:hypothetical protein
MNVHLHEATAHAELTPGMMVTLARGAPDGDMAAYLEALRRATLEQLLPRVSRDGSA